MGIRAIKRKTMKQGQQTKTELQKENLKAKALIKTRYNLKIKTANGIKVENFRNKQDLGNKE